MVFEIISVMISLTIVVGLLSACAYYFYYISKHPEKSDEYCVFIAVLVIISFFEFRVMLISASKVIGYII